MSRHAGRAAAEGGRRPLEWHLTAPTGDGARPHDITGFTHRQIVADVLDKLQAWRLT
ncbi:hypothetical protein [Brevundimonas sp. SORGH_AS_0993]|uniref:hypothetical protein n=1 Tax=Brevundimonas sp. SORGH_AS_0993 TaxID=3041794 RepID=UPI0027D8CBB3|nr:hypothetical protein [Brevundimonas sp. SORGH_AS_0993]